MPKAKVYYYNNELTDDFAGNNIVTKQLPTNYPYVDKNPFFLLGSFVLYHLIARPIVYLIMKVIFATKLKNRKVLKKVKGQGFFIYGNHTGDILDAFRPNTLKIGRKNYIVSNPDAFSIKGIRTIVKMLGAIPLVEQDLCAQKKLLNAIDYRLKQKCSVTIFPEKHIWPYYTKIRPFDPATLYYPVRFNAPVITLTTTYHQRRGIFKSIKRPRVIHYLDGPFYPDKELAKSEARHKLRNEIYQKMLERAEEKPQYSYYQYIKQEEKNG